MMVEIILLNEIKRPVGVRSEHLMSESLSCSFKRFVQMAVSRYTGIQERGDEDSDKRGI